MNSQQYVAGGSPGSDGGVDAILSSMRQHISGLQDKLAVAGAAANRGQSVNEKIAIMKEYQDKVGTLNSCYRSKNRSHLVASLQHENRQILALEEENRQLRFALKELEDGMHLIMGNYRRVFSNTSISFYSFWNSLMQLPADDKAPISRQGFNGCMEFDKFMGMARLAENCIASADEQISEHEKTIAQLRCENGTLRELLHSRYPTIVRMRSQREAASSPDDEASTPEAERRSSIIEVKGSGSGVLSDTAVEEEETAVNNGVEEPTVNKGDKGTSDVDDDFNEEALAKTIKNLKMGDRYKQRSSFGGIGASACIHWPASSCGGGGGSRQRHSINVNLPAAAEGPSADDGEAQAATSSSTTTTAEQNGDSHPEESPPPTNGEDPPESGTEGDNLNVTTASSSPVKVPNGKGHSLSPPATFNENGVSSPPQTCSN